MAPAGRKRRSDGISRDASPSPSNSPEPQQRAPPQSRQRQRQPQSQPQTQPPRSPSASPSDDNDSSHSDALGGGPTQSETQAALHRKLLTKKLVRLALACEYSRTPVRRSDITQKVFRDENGNSIGGGGAGGASFKNVLADAQQVLRVTFGMELQELPSKEKTSLKERRAHAATQGAGGAGGGSAGNRSWMLVSVLPRGYREERCVLGMGNRAPSQEVEAGYVAFYTFVVSLVYLNGGEIAEQRLERFLRRVNAEMQTSWGSWEKIKGRMCKEGYIDKKKDATGGEEMVSYVVGPRGKVEVGTKGVEGLVKSVYGLGVAGEGNDGPKIEEAELAKRLNRSLGTRGGLGGEDREVAGTGSAGQSRDQSQNGTPQPQLQQRPQQQRGRPPRRRAARDDDDDLDD